MILIDLDRLQEAMELRDRREPQTYTCALCGVELEQDEAYKYDDMVVCEECGRNDMWEQAVTSGEVERG